MGTVNIYLLSVYQAITTGFVLMVTGNADRIDGWSKLTFIRPFGSIGIIYKSPN